MGDGSIEEIKRRLDIADVVGDYVQLKKSGTSFKACCPFHQEKTPSFFVNPERQIYHCFGCSEGGDIFAFVQKMEGLEFGDALRLLANKAGVKLESRVNDETRSERRRLLEANQLAAKLFNRLLVKDDRAAAARAYVKRRALSAETVDDFLLGYSPNSWDATMKFLISRGFSSEELFKCGLTVKSDRGAGYYDRFRGRLMFPIRNVHGEVIGFTARILPGADGKDPDGPKYINTPQTLVYDKSHVLYGINLAKQEIRRAGVAVVVEGNMDVISSHQAGVKNVVASSGTALTGEQCAVLRRFADRLVLSFDNDAAGEAAARRGIDTAVAAGFSVRVLRLPPGAGKDPDDCVRKDVKLWQQAIADATPFMSWYIEQATAQTDFSDAESKRRAANILLTEVAKLPEAVERAHWIGELARIFATPQAMLFEELQKMNRSSSSAILSPTINFNPPIKKDRQTLVSEFVLGLILILTTAPAKDGFDPASFESNILSPVDRELYKIFIEDYTKPRIGGDNSLNFRDWLETRGKHETAQRVAMLELQIEKEFGELTTEMRQTEFNKLIGELKLLHLSRQKLELTRIMEAAEKSGDQQKIHEVQEKLKELMG